MKLKFEILQSGICFLVALYCPTLVHANPEVKRLPASQILPVQKIQKDIYDPLNSSELRSRKKLIAAASTVVPGKVRAKNLSPKKITAGSKTLKLATTENAQPKKSQSRIAQNVDFVENGNLAMDPYREPSMENIKKLSDSNDGKGSTNSIDSNSVNSTADSKLSNKLNSSANLKEVNSPTNSKDLNFPMDQRDFSLSRNINDSSAKDRQNSNSPFLDVPVLKSNEFAVFVDNDYQIFQIKQYQGLDLDLSCFKSATPDCIAYKVGKIRVKEVVPYSDGEFHQAATLCQRLSGKSLIAFDSKKRAYNFCRFSDGSMVDSWSAYNQSFSVPKIR